MKKGIAHIFLLLIVFVLPLVVAGSYYFIQGNNSSKNIEAGVEFLETFDGSPASPTPWNSDRWDIVSVISDMWNYDETWDEMPTTLAHHGEDCSPPFATHTIALRSLGVYQCRNHLMTAANHGYQAIYLTPNHLVDFTNGEAVIKFDISTFKSSGRDWFDIWITPFDENFILPLETTWPAYSGPPKKSITIKNGGGGDGQAGGFDAFTFDNFVETGLSRTPQGWKTVGQVLQENGLQAAADRRDTFEIRISRNHLKFCMPNYGHCWFDTSIPDLGFTQGVVQFGHHAYNPMKDCTPNPPLDCAPVTWHWDNMYISSATPFTLIKGDRTVINRTTPNRVNFSQPSPENAKLRFAGVARIEYSVDGGATWKQATKKQQVNNAPEHFDNYWVSIPAGVTAVDFRGFSEDYIGKWTVAYPSIWANTGSTGGTGGVQPSSAPTVSSPPTVIGSPTPVPTPTPRPTPTPTPVPTPTPLAPNTISFNDKTQGALSGQYPAGIIDWGSGKWFVSNPWGLFTTNSISFDEAGPTAETASFMNPALVKSIEAYNGGSVASTISLACGNNPTKTATVNTNTKVSISTGWTANCSVITFTSSNGWDTNFDNIVWGSGATVSSPTPVASPAVSAPPATGEFKADFFNNRGLSGSPVKTINTKIINYNWGTSKPLAEVNADNFSVRLTGTFNFDGSTYRFNTTADDGVRIKVDGVTVIGGWRDQSATTYNKLQTLTGTHTVVVEMYERTGNAVLIANWVKASTCFDMTGDGQITDADVNVVASKWGKTGITPWDLNGDRTVNSADMGLISQRKGTSCS